MAKGIGVDIRGSMRSVIRDMWMVQRKYVPQAVASALNDTARAIQGEAARQASEKTGVPPMMMRKSVMPRGWATRRRLSVPIYLHLWGVPATKLGPKERGADVALLQARPKKTLVDAFLLPPGHKTRGGRSLRYGAVLRDKGDSVEAVALEHAEKSLPILDGLMRTKAGPIFVVKFRNRMGYALKRSRGK